MSKEGPLLLALDLLGTFAFGLNGAMTAPRAARLDLVGVVTLGMITAFRFGWRNHPRRPHRLAASGDLPDWRYLAVAAVGGCLPSRSATRLDPLAGPITVLDAVGLSRSR